MNNRIKAQIKGGQLLADVKDQLVKFAKVGTKFEDIDALAEELIIKSGSQPSFKSVPGYHWSTCINTNSGFVHGIPKGTLKDSDLVTIDVGLIYDGYHTDTSTSFVVGQSNDELDFFLKVGKKTLKKAINQAISGNRVWDISHTIQKNVEKEGFSLARNLTGHGIGTQLHMDPSIPCFTHSPRLTTPKLVKDQALAIEVMYTMGDYQTVTGPDNWTISTKDGSLSAVFEETILVGDKKPRVLTRTT